MTGPSQAIHIGQEVEIIGPAFGGIHASVGEKGKLSDIDRGGYLVSGLWYPASSLRLVEPELKIGDYAEVVLPGSYLTGKIGKVADVSNGEYPVCLEGMGVWSKGTLRKLTPEEVESHLHPVKFSMKVDFSRFLEGIEKAQDKLWKLQVEQRLAAIEKRQSAICKYNIETEQPLQKLEASQKEAMENPLDGEKRTRSRLEAERLSVLRAIARHMLYLMDHDLIDGSQSYPMKKLEQLDRIEKQIAEGQ